MTMVMGIVSRRRGVVMVMLLFLMSKTPQDTEMEDGGIIP
jgi:hypothetical protein